MVGVWIQPAPQMYSRSGSRGRNNPIRVIRRYDRPPQQSTQSYNYSVSNQTRDVANFVVMVTTLEDKSQELVEARFWDIWMKSQTSGVIASLFSQVQVLGIQVTFQITDVTRTNTDLPQNYGIPFYYAWDRDGIVDTAYPEFNVENIMSVAGCQQFTVSSAQFGRPIKTQVWATSAAERSQIFSTDLVCGEAYSERLVSQLQLWNPTLLITCPKGYKFSYTAEIRASVRCRGVRVNPRFIAPPEPEVDPTVSPVKGVL